MIQVKCIQKFRDNQGRIYGYRLADVNQQTQDVTSENLKKAIKSGKINVVNLTLTSDNRLVDTSEKLLQNKSLGKAPVRPGEKVNNTNGNNYSNVAKALVLLDKELLDMGVSYREVVACRVISAEGATDSYGLDGYLDSPEYINCGLDEALDKILYMTYMKLLNNKPNEIVAIMELWDELDNYATFENNLQYERVSNISSSKIYKALYIVYKHATEHKYSKTATEPLKKFLQRVRETGVASVNMGFQIGYCYFRYLDKNVFGTISNDAFTVGHKIVSSELKEHKEYRGYDYILHKDINRCGAPSITLAAMFKNDTDGNVQIDVRIARRGYINSGNSCSGIVGYLNKLGSFTISPDDPVEECGKRLANIFNTLGPKLYEIADNNQSLYNMRPYGAPLEQLRKDVVTNYTDEQMLHLAISRWTKIRGDRTAAKVERIDRSGEGLRVLYSNNISSNSNRLLKLVASYRFNDEMFTIRVINSGYLNDTLFSESAPVSGNIKENSVIISEVLAKALITANVRRI